MRLLTRARATSDPRDVRPNLTLWLISAQHALIHAQGALLPLVFIEIIRTFEVGPDAVAYLVGVAGFLTGAIQLSFGALTRVFSRRAILGIGGIITGTGLALLSATTSWIAFAAAVIVSRLGGAPQHAIGNALLAEQFPPHRLGFAIAVHIAVGNLGTVAVPLVGGWIIATSSWQASVLAIGLPGLAVASAILILVREQGDDRALAREGGGVLRAFASLRSERELRWIFLASSIAAAGRGIGIVSTFVPLYLALVLGLDTATVALMYTLLLAGSVPGPIAAGWVADRVGHKPVLVATYVGGTLGITLLVLAGGTIPLVWLGIGFVSAFVFEESSLLQALLAEASPRAVRDVAFSAYFTLMFVVAALWSAALGAIVGLLGPGAGFPVAFGVMAASYVLAALAVLPLRVGGPRRSASTAPATADGG